MLCVPHIAERFETIWIEVCPTCIVYLNAMAATRNIFAFLCSSSLVSNEEDNSTSGDKLGSAVINALVFVAAVIGTHLNLAQSSFPVDTGRSLTWISSGATFLLVCLYYFKCIKVRTSHAALQDRTPSLAPIAQYRSSSDGSFYP